MKQISTVKNQTVFDLAVQAYGNMEAAFQILVDNPHLVGANDLPIGYNLPVDIDFDISYPIKEGTMIYLQDYLQSENTMVASQLDKVIS